jgi:hypothetical protein
MKIRMLAAVAISTAATTLPLAAIAHADASYQFKSPTGNIACILDGMTSISGSELGSAVCDIVDYTWAAPPLPANCRFPHGPVFYLNQRYDNQGPAATIDQCGPGNSGINLTPALQTLDYGQTHSVGAINCDSESSGVTCTDAGTGHFFRVSRDSYQVG